MQNNVGSLKPNDRLILVAAGSLGMALGVACVWFSGQWVLGVVAALLFTYALLRRPEIGLLGILIATSSVVFEGQLPLLSVGGISVHISDFLLIALLGLVALRRFAEPNFKIARTPLDWPLLIFLGVTVFWTLVSMYQSTVDPLIARRWIRYVLYYLTFFAVTNLVRERRQLELLLNSLFLMATIVAVAMAAQYLLGPSAVIIPGTVDILATKGIIFSDVTRLVPPGLSIVIVAFVTTLCILVLETTKPMGLLRFSQVGLLGIALLFTFLRSYWVALIVIIALLALLLKRSDRQRFVAWGLLALFSAGVILVWISSLPTSPGTKLLSASTNRFGSLLDPGTFQGADTSLTWRIKEDQYALSAIAAHPFVGLGLGANFRPWDYLLDSDADMRYFIHNGHLWILLDTGLFGYLAFLWLSAAFLIRGFRFWRLVSSNRLRAIVLGFTLTYLAVFVAAIVNSTFVQWTWTPVIGIMMGVNEIILLKFREEQLIS